MDGLHRAGIAHRSLRAANVIVNGDMRPWLTDFSFSQLGATQRQKDLDLAELLALLATLVAVDRAVSSAAVVIGAHGTAGRAPGPAMQPAARRRRPTGAPPPLPHPVSVTTTAWLVAVVVVLAGAIVVSLRAPSLRLDDQANAAVLRFFARARTPWLTGVANGIVAAGSGWGATVVGLSAVVLTMVFRRWRHLLVFVCSLFFLELAMQLITDGLQRPRPYGVPIIAGWAGYSAPALAVGILTLFLMGVTYCLVVPGRPRSYAKAASAVIVTVLCLAYLYLAVDHVDDVLLGAVLGVAIPVTAFRFFTPNEVFPVTYRRGNTAHVDVTGRRGEAIRHGVRDQLGLTVTEIMPVGLESQPAPRRCGCGSKAARMSTCSPSCTPRVTSAPTAGTSCGAPSFTVRWKTSTPSRPCGAWPSTRTTPCASCRMPGSAWPGPTASWSSPPNGSTW